MTAATAVATATLEITGLTAGYGGAPVLRDLSLTVSGGEVVALMGANGAGKTTTLRAISGLVKPDTGTIALEGRDLAALSPTARVRAGVVHVPQDRGIFYGLTVGEHFRLDGHGEDRHEAAFEHFPALRDLRQRRAGLLSGGEQQMLAIARALMRRPKLLLLDELSLGLAPIIVERLLPVVRAAADDRADRGAAGGAARAPGPGDRRPRLRALTRRAGRCTTAPSACAATAPCWPPAISASIAPESAGRQATGERVGQRRARVLDPPAPA